MISKSSKCIECKACAQKCPKNCISFLENGELIINYKNCINCKLCEGCCQLLVDINKYKIKKVYAAIQKNKKESVDSASGGISQIIYNYILDNNGIVFGAKYNNDLVPEITFATSKRELDEFKKSKYVFSDTANSYKKCKEFLDAGKKVVFIALPCQVAGLRLFLNKEYKNLYVVDILCHGAPHPQIFKNHIRYIESKEKRKVKNYVFRNKRNDIFGPYNYEIDFEKGKSIRGSAIWDVYYNNFVKGNILRECCYSCKYASLYRVGDISIGDFWRANSIIQELKDEKYISSLLINNEKGFELVDLIKDDIICYESSVEELEKSTHALKSPQVSNNKVDVDSLKNYKNYKNWARIYDKNFKLRLSKAKFKLLHMFDI